MPIFRSRHQAGLLTWLFLHHDQEYSLTDLAKRLDVPLTTLHREGKRLVEAGLLNSRSVGRTRLWQANSDNRAASPLTQLLKITFGPQAVIGDEFRFADIQQVLIYGSWADRYDGSPRLPPRDINVLVVGKAIVAETSYI